MGSPDGMMCCGILASYQIRTPNRECLHAWQAAFSGKGNKALDNGVASTSGAFDNILMNGQEVFKFAVRAVPTVRLPPALGGS